MPREQSEIILKISISALLSHATHLPVVFQKIVCSKNTEPPYMWFNHLLKACHMNFGYP